MILLSLQGNPTDKTLITSGDRHFYLPLVTDTGKTAIVTLNNLIFKNGYAPTCGGSVFNRAGGHTLILNHCQFINNSAGSSGGAIDNSLDSKLIVNDCLFENSNCPLGSGAIFNTGEAVITNSTFIGNTSRYSAGAIFNSNTSTLFVSNCIFTNNRGGDGGVLVNRGRATLSNCLLTGNTSTAMINCYKYEHYDDAEITIISIINTTIADNMGQGVYSEQETFIQNSIIWNTTAENDILLDSAKAIVCYSLIGKSNFNLNSDNNLSQNPLFVGNGNYQLSELSPAKDAGNNTLYPLIDYPKDLQGNNRISNNTIDLGAYEYQTVIPTITLDKHQLFLYVDSVAQKLTATITPEDQKISWNSLHKNIATVDANGNVTAIAKGETKVIATAGTVNDTCVVTVTDKMGMGIVNAGNRAIIIYPNPVKEVLTIQTTEKINSVIIIDTEGRIVKQLAKYNGSISVSELPSGVYFIRIQTLKGETIQRFVKK